jgi:hypothetical protein
MSCQSALMTELWPLVNLEELGDQFCMGSSDRLDMVAITKTKMDYGTTFCCRQMIKLPHKNWRTKASNLLYQML